MQQEVMVAQPPAAQAATLQGPVPNGMDQPQVQVNLATGQATTARSGATILQADVDGAGAMDETVSFAGRADVPPSTQDLGSSLEPEPAARRSQAVEEASMTNFDRGGAGAGEQAAGVSQVASTGFATPRSMRNGYSGGAPWVAGLEVPAWVSRLGSYLSLAPQNDLLPSPLGGSQGSQRSLPGGPSFVLRNSRPTPSPPTPSSSSLPQEAIQAEVQRQLGQVLQRLRVAEQRNEELESELATLKQGGGGMRQPAFPGLESGDVQQVRPSRVPDPPEHGRDPDLEERGPGEVPLPPELEGGPGTSELLRDAAPGRTTSARTSRVATSGGITEGIRSLLGGGTRPPTPPIPRDPSTPRESPVLEMLARGMKQLQDIQAQTLARSPSSPSQSEVVKPGTLTLSPLPEYRASDGAGSSALQLQDWLEVAATVLADVSENSGAWWSAVMDLVNETYSQWLAATPLERLQIAPKGAEALCTGRWTRVNARIASMLLTAMGEELRGEMVGQRITQSSPRMVFRLFVLFQPGGSAERQEVLKKLQNPSEFLTGDGLEDVLKAVRAWPRWLARCISVNMSPPDASVMVRGLMNLTTKYISMSPDAAFRTAMLRTSLRLDARPTISQVQEYQRHLQAELETLLSSTSTVATSSATAGAPKMRAMEATSGQRTKEKERAGSEMCRYFMKPSGCRRGNRCSFSHNMASLDKETRARKCLLCGAEGHRQRECTVNKSGAKSKASSAATTSMAKTGDTAPSSSQPPAMAAITGPQGEGGDNTVQGVPWTLESLLQAVQAQVVHNASEGEKSPEKTPAAKVLIVRDIRVCSLRSSSSALLDSGATHSLRSAVSWDEWLRSEEVEVQLAGNHSLKMRMSGLDTLLMPPQPNHDPMAQQPQTIVPLGELVKILGYTMRWSREECTLEGPEGEIIHLSTNSGCPQLCEAEALALIARLEERKREQLENETLITEDRITRIASCMDRSWFEYLLNYTNGGPREAGLRALRDAPFFQGIPGECLSALIPPEEQSSGWETLKKVTYLTRPQRRTLLSAKKWVVHLFAGEEGHMEFFRQHDGDTVVLEVDIRQCRGHDLLGASPTWKMLLWGARSGKVDMVFGGPPGRDGKTFLPFAPEETNLKPLSLICRMLWLFVVASAGRMTTAKGATRHKEVGFMIEHPGKSVSTPSAIREGRPFLWETRMWQEFAMETGMFEVSFEQGGTGASTTMSTVLGTNIQYLRGLEGIKADSKPETTTPQEVDQSRWSPGLVKALVVAFHMWSRSPQVYAMSPEQWKKHVDASHLPYRRDCATCVMAKGTGRRHGRVSHPDSYVLTSDLSGPLKAGLDSAVKGTPSCNIRYLLVAKYFFPKDFVRAYSGKEPPSNEGMEHSPLPESQGDKDNLEEEPGTSVLDEIPDYELSEQEELPDDREPLLEDCDGGGEADDKEEEEPPEGEGGDGGKPGHAAMRTGDCNPPEMTSLVFAVGIPNNKASTIKGALQDVILYLGAHGLPVLRFHSDRGEYYSTAFKAWLREQGIRGTWAEPGIPQTNGHAEATVKWIKNRIRTMLVASGLPVRLWPAAAETAAAEQRASVLGWKSLLLAPFGTVVHVKKRPYTALGPRRSADTFDPRWARGRYVGLSGLLDRGHLVFLPEEEGKGEGFFHTFHVRPNLVDPGEPTTTLEADEVIKPATRLTGKTRPSDVMPRIAAIEKESRGDVEEEANQALKFDDEDLDLEMVEKWFRNGTLDNFKAGAYRHGGVVGVMNSTWEFPHMTQILTRILQRSMPEATFTAILVSTNTLREVHKDVNNDSSTLNYLVPVVCPRKGGGVWVQLQPGDVVQGELSQRPNSKGEMMFGNVHPLKKGKCISFSPKRAHEVMEWTGDRVVIIGYTPHCHGRMDYSMVRTLENLGFQPPLSQLPEFYVPRPEEIAVNSVSTTEVTLNEQCEQVEPELGSKDWELFLEVEDGEVKIGGGGDGPFSPTIPSVNKAEVSYTSEIEELLSSLTAPLDVVHNVDPKEVLRSLEKWIPAIQKEVKGVEHAIERLRTGTTSRASWLQRQGVQRLPTKFVYTVKPNDKADPNDPSTWFKRKARLVVCGNMALINNPDLYTEAAPAEAVRAALTLTCKNQWTVGILDVVMAFLKTPMGRSSRDPVVVVQPPKLLERLNMIEEFELWGLIRALYGLKESPRLWGSYRDHELASLTMQMNDAMLQLRKGKAVTAWWTVLGSNNEIVAVIVIYVDDFVICGSRNTIMVLAQGIQQLWETTELQLISQQQPLRFLGMEIYLRGGEGEPMSFSIAQEAYIRELLRTREISSTQLDRIPLSKDAASFAVLENDIPPNDFDVHLAQQLTGELLWISQRSRPDLAFVTSLMSTLTTRAPSRVIAIAYKALGYLQRTQSRHLTIAYDGTDLSLFCDAAYAPESGRSHSGWSVFWGGSAIVWRSGRQSVISLSTAESELIALLDGAVATLGVEALLQDVGVVVASRTIYTDSTSALAISSGTGGWRTRHLRIKAGWLQEQLDAGIMAIKHCAGRIQLADLLTKALPAQRISDLLVLWGVTDEQPARPTTRTSSNISAKALLALVCCMLIVGAKSEEESVNYQNRLSVDWDMVGWLVLFLAVAGVVAVWEAAKWATAGMLEWTPGAGARRLRKLQRLEAATRRALEVELDRLDKEEANSSLIQQASSPIPQASSPIPQASSPIPQASSLIPQASSLIPQASSPIPQASSLIPQASSPIPQEASTSSTPRATVVTGMNDSLMTPRQWSQVDEPLMSSTPSESIPEDWDERPRVCLDLVMLMVVEDIRAGLREEGLPVTGSKKDMAERLSANLVEGAFPSRALPSTRQYKYVLYLWNQRGLKHRTRLKWENVNTRHKISQWLAFWKDA